MHPRSSASHAAAGSPQGTTRSSQAPESHVKLPLTLTQRKLVLQLDFFKRWYLICHAGYLMFLVLFGTAVLFVTEPHVALVDAFFVAMSTVCNCGLQTVDVGGWHPLSVFFRHVLMIGGGVVFTSAYQPLMRLFMLHRVAPVFAPCAADTPEQRQLRHRKEDAAARLYYTSAICAMTSFAYFAVVNGGVMFSLYLLNSSQLSALEVFYMGLSSFHSCVFLPMTQYAGDTAVVGLVTVACSLGFTAFPAVLRGFFHLERHVYRVCRRAHQALLRSSDLAEDDSVGDDSAPLITAAGVATAAEANGDASEQPSDPWERGFDDILSSPHPGCFHPFLFLPDESAYLGAAWWALTIMQAVPFWFQHWHSLLDRFTPMYKVYLAICQAGVIRFAAASFVSLHEYSNAHIAVTILAMYLPALPISTDRTYRKWRQMMATSVMRLLTSRLFWLFAAMVSIIFTEEASMREALRGTRFDMMTRTFFEVISAYSGCGLSLSLPDASVSFTGSAGNFAKLVICAVLFGGRHRFVDLGIDLGFNALQTDLQFIFLRGTPTNDQQV